MHERMRPREGRGTCTLSVRGLRSTIWEGNASGKNLDDPKYDNAWIQSTGSKMYDGEVVGRKCNVLG